MKSKDRKKIEKLFANHGYHRLCIHDVAQMLNMDVNVVNGIINNIASAGLLRRLELDVCPAKNIVHRKFMVTKKLRKIYGFEEGGDKEPETELEEETTDEETPKKRKYMKKNKPIEGDKSINQVLDDIENGVKDIRDKLNRLKFILE